IPYQKKRLPESFIPARVLNHQKDQSCEQVDAIAREHLAEVDRKLAGLTALRAELLTLIEQCSLRSIRECRIIEALAISM
ncbi:MerR family DNA-binding protein, partial [Acidiphilium rubrum]|uniref:MerR family DNA-binding protein n=1 Tax=Acidiphilium rubrum TaxID=526 RepID=UPI002C4182EE